VLLACSELSSDVPGLATHFLKHLSDIFYNQKYVQNLNNYSNTRNYSQESKTNWNCWWEAEYCFITQYCNNNHNNYRTRLKSEPTPKTCTNDYTFQAEILLNLKVLQNSADFYSNNLLLLEKVQHQNQSSIFATQWLRPTCTAHINVSQSETNIRYCKQRRLHCVIT